MNLTLVPLSTAAPGRPLLVVGPSLGTSVETLWSRCAAELAPHLEIVGWELPGHGRGAPTRERFTVEQLAADVVTAVDSRYGAGTAFTYAGDSIGGAVGLALLLDHAERITAATLCCTGARIGTRQSWDERAAAVRAGGTAAVVEGSITRWFGPGFRDREPAAAEALLDALRAADDESYALACGALADFDVRERVAAITRPLTLVGGRHDVPTPVAGLREIADAVGHARLVELDVAHLAPAEDPVTVAALIAADPTSTRTAADARADGMRVRREVAGDAYVDRAVAGTTGLTREFQDFITQYAWGSVWTRPGLDRRSRSLVTLTALVARGHHEELALHLRGALTNGLTRDEIAEVLLQCAVYLGVPDANAAFRVAQRVFDELDGNV